MEVFDCLFACLSVGSLVGMFDVNVRLADIVSQSLPFWVLLFEHIACALHVCTAMLLDDIVCTRVLCVEQVVSPYSGLFSLSAHDAYRLGFCFAWLVLVSAGWLARLAIVCLLGGLLVI